nr:LOW QUALITY PROTEIN: uncharacterized protein LOC128700688 [Cherax quadricarinatus]
MIRCYFAEEEYLSLVNAFKGISNALFIIKIVPAVVGTKTVGKIEQKAGKYFTHLCSIGQFEKKMFVLMEPRNTQFVDTDENSRSCNDVCSLDSKEICCNVYDNAHCSLQNEMEVIPREDGHCKADSDILGYSVIEKHKSDSCLTVRIAVKKGNSSIKSEDQNAINEIAHEGDSQNDRMPRCMTTPGMWKPPRRRKKNLYSGKRKKSFRIECMVPGCFTRAYSSRFVKFPDDVEWRIKWARKSKLNEKFPDVDPREVLPGRIGLCMGHFREDDFHVICRGDGKVCQLKMGVEPSIFPWGELPSNVNSAMSLFENTKFSREMRLLNIMKNELHSMMNPPKRFCTVVPGNTLNLSENNTLKMEKSSIDHQDTSKTSKFTESSNCETKILNECEDTSTDPLDTCQSDEFWSFPRTRKFRVPINYDESILSEEIDDLEGDESKSLICYSSKRNKSKVKLHSESKIVSESAELEGDKISLICYSSKRNKNRVKLHSESVVINENKEIAKDSTEIVENNGITYNLPRKCKMEAKAVSDSSNVREVDEILQYSSDQESNKVFDNFLMKQVRFPRKSKLNSGLCSIITEKNNSVTSKDKTFARHGKQYDKKTKRKNVTNLNCNEECVYDIKIENCEVEVPEVDFNNEDSNPSFSMNQEQICGEFSHFLSPISNSTLSNEQPYQDVLGSLNAQIIASCIEAAMTPMMAKLELFQGKVESKIEQLEGRVNSRLENLEGRVNLCLEKLEHVSSSHHSKASTISSGIWLNKCDHVSENSSHITPSNGMTTPVHYTDISLKPFAISETEYEMMEG